VATAGVALTVGAPDGQASGHGMASMMSSRTEDGGSRTEDDGSGQDRGSGMRGLGMHGTAVDSEFAYLAEMVPHHEEAVTAARELQRSNRPQMRAFGAAIVATQTAQIEQMRTWLARWYPGRDSSVDYRPMMRDLSGLSGDALDRAFLEDMPGHHMMAVMMSQQLLGLALARHDQVTALAGSIRDEQHAEIIQMRRWQADWFDGDTGGMGGMGPWMMR
jgi:uncharacterized protein (DUF305 family)